MLKNRLDFQHITYLVETYQQMLCLDAYLFQQKLMYALENLSTALKQFHHKVQNKTGLQFPSF